MSAVDYDIETPRHIAHGITVFQAALINNSEEETVDAIYDALLPDSDSLILDLGCGIGGVASLMLDIDDTLKFLGVSNSRFQVDYITNLYHPSIAALHADFANVPIPDESVDYVMLNEAIIFGEAQSVLAESFRVLKKGGRILVKNFLIDEKDAPMIAELIALRGCKPCREEDLNAFASDYNMTITHKAVCGCSFEKGLDFFLNDPLMLAKYSGVKSIAGVDNQQIIISILEKGLS